MDYPIGCYSDLTVSFARSGACGEQPTVPLRRFAAQPQTVGVAAFSPAGVPIVRPVVERRKQGPPSVVLGQGPDKQ